LWSAQRKGEAVSSKELLELEEKASERQILILMQQLTQARIVTRNQDDRWILARDINEVTLGELYHCGNYYLPLAEENELPLDSAWDRLFVQSLATVHDNGEAVLNRSLGGMYRESVAQDHQQIDGRKTHHES